MKIRNTMSPRIVSWETLALVQNGIEGWPFKTRIINSICEILHKENKWIALNRSLTPPKKKPTAIRTMSIKVIINYRKIANMNFVEIKTR